MNKRFQKLFIILTCLIMLLSLTFSIGAGAQTTVGEVTIYSDAVFAQRGQEFTTTLYLKADSNLSALSFALSYDKNLLTLSTATSEIGSVSTQSGQVSLNYSSSENLVEKTDVLSLTFITDDQIEVTTHSDYIKLISSSASTLTGSEVGEMSVIADFADMSVRKIGDVYNNKGDGKINARDASKILQHVARVSEIPENELIYANVYEDYNSDGTPKINARDASMVLQFVARVRDDIDNFKTVKFLDSDGNKIVAKSVLTGEGVVNVPQVPEIAGMAGKWSLSKDSYVEPNLSEIDGDITLYPYYEETATRYTVTFNLGGASGSIDAVKVVEGESFSAPSLSGVTPKTGYSFVSWVDESGAEYDFSTPVVKDITLTATWTNKYTLKYRSFAGASWKTRTYTYGATVAKVADPKRTGYIFTGWDIPFPTTMPAKNLEITGTWQVITNTVTFDLNGAKGEIDPVEVASGKAVTEPSMDDITLPSENTTFLYWATEDGEEYNFASVVNQDMTLYAIYSGTVEVRVNWMVSGVEDTVIDVKWNTSVKLPVYTTIDHNPKNSVFDGFYYENGVEYDTYDVIKSDTVLHAIWGDDGSFDTTTFTYKSTPSVDYSSSIGSSTGVDLSDGGSVSLTFDVLSSHTFANFQTKVSALSWIPGILENGYNNYWQGCGSIGLAGNPAYTETAANYHGYVSGIMPDTYQEDGHLVFGTNTANPNLVMTKGNTVKVVYTAPTQTTTGSFVYYVKATGADDSEYVEACSMRNILLSDVHSTDNVYLWLDFYNCSAGPGATMSFANFNVEFDGRELPIMLFNHYDEEITMEDKDAVIPSYNVGVNAVQSGMPQVGWLMSETATPIQNGGTLYLEMDVLESNLASHNINIGVSLFNYLGVSNDYASGFHDSQWIGNPMYLDDQDGYSNWKVEDVSNKNTPTLSPFYVEEIWSAGNSVRIEYEIPTSAKDGHIKIYTKLIEGLESEWTLVASVTGIKPDMIVNHGEAIMLGMIFQATVATSEPMILKVQNLHSYSSVIGDINLVAQHNLIFSLNGDEEVESDGLFTMDGNTITGLTTLGKAETDLVIPSEIDGVEIVKIGQKAFMGSEIQSVSIPATVTSIGDEAFRGVETLDSVVFATGSKLTFVGDSVFRDCTSLTDITLPNGVQSVGELAFYNCAETKYGNLYSLNLSEKQFYAPKFTYEFMGEDVMPIGGYIEPSVGYLSVSLEEAVKTMLDSGTNMMFAIGQGRYGTTYQNYFEMLSYLEKYGGMMLKNGMTQNAEGYDGTYGSMPQALQDVQTYYVDEYASYAGHHVVDEPGVSSWIPEMDEYYVETKTDNGDGTYTYTYAISEQDMGKAHLAWTEHYNRKLYYVNLLPVNSPVNALVWGADGYALAPNVEQIPDYIQYTQYDEYYKSYIKNVKPRVFSFDFYPLWANGQGNNSYLTYPTLNSRHFEQLYKAHYYTVDYSTEVNGFAIPFWNFVQVTSWGNQSSGSRAATYNELLWQVNTAFAFGSKGYQYFIFNDYGDRSGAGASSGYGNLPMNIDGTPGESYYDVTNVNRQSQAMAKWLLNANVDHIAQYGSNPNGESINSSMFVKEDKNMAWSLSSTSGKNHLVSYMKYYEDNNDYRADSDGGVRELYFVCNNSNLTSNNGSITLNFNKTVSGSYIYNGVEYAFSGSSLTVPNTVAGSGFAVLLDK